MGRPRKNSSTPEARRRLHSAFWDLLESNELHEITVGTIAAKASCNRGTFYYHYRDIDELIGSAIEEEILRDDAIPVLVLNLITGIYKENYDEAVINLRSRIHHFSLLLDRGGMDVVYATVKSTVISLWETALCADGATLADETRVLLEFYVNGMLGMVAYEAHQDANTDLTHLSESIFPDLSYYMLGQIGKHQNLSREEVLSRISLLGQLRGRPSKQTALKA